MPKPRIIYEIYDRMSGKVVATADTYPIAFNVRARRDDARRLVIRERETA